MAQATDACPVMMMKATGSHGRALWESQGGGGQEGNEEIIPERKAWDRTAATAQGKART